KSSIEPTGRRVGCKMASTPQRGTVRSVLLSVGRCCCPDGAEMLDPAGEFRPPLRGLPFAVCPGKATHWDSPSLLDDRDFPKGFERTSLTPLHRLNDAGHTVPSARRFIPQSNFLTVGARLLAF